MKQSIQQSSHDVIRQRLLHQRGLDFPEPKCKIEDLEKSQWSDEFETKMRNRLIMGALRYGILGDPAKPTYDNTSSIIKRANLYVETGNLEHLVDIANLCLVEFIDGKHPNRHFHSADDTSEHVSKL